MPATDTPTPAEIRQHIHDHHSIEAWELVESLAGWSKDLDAYAARQRELSAADRPAEDNVRLIAALDVNRRVFTSQLQSLATDAKRLIELAKHELAEER